jgi:predicted metal-dependent phosphotriesterase family hydrolase
MPYARTVLGDIAPEALGIVYAHEHLVIHGGRPVELFPDFELADVDKAVAELAPVQALGLRTVVDAMPADCGRDVLMLAQISLRSGVHVIAPSGLHHERYYHDRHWSVRLDEEEIADLFVADITEGIDELDYNGPVVKRTEHRAGVMKVAGSTGGLSARDQKVFVAAALAQQRTGCPILTHCEGGTGAIEQVEWLVRHGADPAHIVLSHVDKVVDREYMRTIAATGARVEYDQGFRWGDEPNGTLQLLAWAAEDGLLGHVTLGLDAARQGYWTQFGGSPGWAYLLAGFSDLLRARGLGDAELHTLFVEAPGGAYTFGAVPDRPQAGTPAA